MASTFPAEPSSQPRAIRRYTCNPLAVQGNLFTGKDHWRDRGLFFGTPACPGLVLKVRGGGWWQGGGSSGLDRFTCSCLITPKWNIDFTTRRENQRLPAARDPEQGRSLPSFPALLLEVGLPSWACVVYGPPSRAALEAGVLP